MQSSCFNDDENEIKVLVHILVSPLNTNKTVTSFFSEFSEMKICQDKSQATIRHIYTYQPKNAITEFEVDTQSAALRKLSQSGARP